MKVFPVWLIITAMLFGLVLNSCSNTAITSPTKVNNQVNQQLLISQSSPSLTAPPKGITAPPRGFTAPPRGFTVPPRGFTIPPRSFTIPPRGFTLTKGTIIFPASTHKDLFSVPPRGLTAPPKGFTMPPGGVAIPALGLTIPPRGFEIESLTDEDIQTLVFHINGTIIPSERLLIQSTDTLSNGDIQVRFVTNAIPDLKHLILSVTSPSGVVILGQYLEQPTESITLNLEQTALALLKLHPQSQDQSFNFPQITPIATALLNSLQQPQLSTSILYTSEVREAIERAFTQTADKQSAPLENQIVKSLEITPSHLKLNQVGDTQILQAIGSNGPQNYLNLDIRWSSANPTIATVNPNGLVEAIGIGTTTVYAKYKELKTEAIVSVDSNAFSQPVINEISPSNVKPGEHITIRGDGFALKPDKNTVKLDNESLEVTANSSKEIVVEVPSNLTGKVNVTVSNSLGLSESASFNIAPTITSLDKTQMFVGDNLTILGQYFEINNTTVTISGIQAMISSMSSTSITLVVPSGTTATTGPVIVTTSGGQATYSNPLTIGTNVATIAGSGPTGIGNGGFADGTALSAVFNDPVRLIYDANGNLIISDQANNRIRKMDTAGNVTTLAGSGTQGFLDGPALTAQFDQPYGIAIDSVGNIYIGDNQNYRVRKIDTGGNVTTFAGTGIQGLVDGPGVTAQFGIMSDLVIDSQDNLYLNDLLNHVIRKIDSGGNVTTFAGTGVAGYTNGPGASAQFHQPMALAIDANNNIYVADTFNYVIRKITSAGTVSTFAGNGVQGVIDGPATSASFDRPGGLYMDSQGRLLIASTFNSRIRMLENGVVSTLAGQATPGFNDGSGSVALFDYPTDITEDSAGNLIISDLYNHRIRKLDR